MGFLSTDWRDTTACLPPSAQPVCNKDAFSVLCTLQQQQPPAPPSPPTYPSRWTGISYGDGYFVVVSDGGLNDNLAMTSADNGISWIGHPTASDKGFMWQGIAYGDKAFVAVAADGIVGRHRTMTSTDNGFTWAGHPSADDSCLLYTSPSPRDS